VSREHISLTTKLAAAICVILEIPHEHQQMMTDDQVLSLVQWDHYPIRRDDGLALGMSVAEVDRFSNLFPKSIIGHREKTAKVDAPQMAKSRHIREAQAGHRAVMAQKAGDSAAVKLAPQHRSRWPQGRTIQSRPMHGKIRGGR
jgi:hypothetical protein